MSATWWWRQPISGPEQWGRGVRKWKMNDSIVDTVISYQIVKGEEEKLEVGSWEFQVTSMKTILQSKKNHLNLFLYSFTFSCVRWVSFSVMKTCQWFHSAFPNQGTSGRWYPQPHKTPPETTTCKLRIAWCSFLPYLDRGPGPSLLTGWLLLKHLEPNAGPLSKDDKQSDWENNMVIKQQIHRKQIHPFTNFTYTRCTS